MKIIENALYELFGIAFGVLNLFLAYGISRIYADAFKVEWDRTLWLIVFVVGWCADGEVKGWKARP